MNQSNQTPQVAGPRHLRTGLLLAVAVAATAVVTQVVPAIAQGPATASAAIPVVQVHEGKIIDQRTVLGPQYAPTTLVSTKPLPAGNYLVTAIVGLVISPHDQVVCAVSTVSTGGNDGVFGTAGNPADGTAGIYGTATMTDTIKVTYRQKLYVTCNSFNYGKGTYAHEAVIEAVPAVVHR